MGRLFTENGLGFCPGHIIRVSPFGNPTFSDPSDPTFFWPEFLKNSQPSVFFLVVGGNS